MEVPKRPEKCRLEEAMKNFSDDGKDSEMSLCKEPRKPSLGYMYTCVSVSMCVFMHSMKNNRSCACRKFLWTDTHVGRGSLSLPAELLTSVLSGSVRMAKSPGYMGTTLSMETQGMSWQNHSSIMVRLLIVAHSSCLSTPALLGITTLSPAKRPTQVGEDGAISWN